jgi:hypothetical protein
MSHITGGGFTPLSAGRNCKNTMVRVVQNNDKELYQCEECGFHYQDKTIAEKCEAWCREHKSCNIEITSHAEENKSEVNN